MAVINSVFAVRCITSEVLASHQCDGWEWVHQDNGFSAAPFDVHANALLFAEDMRKAGLTYVVTYRVGYM